MSWLELLDGTRLRCSIRGAGPPVVLVHGWKQSHRAWDRVVGRLAEHHRVIAYDHRGMGESDKPDSRYDFDELAGDLGQVLAKLDVHDATLVGWSMGATVALRYLETGGGAVERLMLLNGPVRLTRTDGFPHTMTTEQLGAYLQEVEARWPEAERAFQAESLHNPHPELVDWLWGIAIQTPLDVVLRVVREQAKLDMRAAVGGLGIPVLAAYGRHDPYYPTSLGDWIAERAPDGRAVIFEHSAHCPPIEEPERFCSVLERFARLANHGNGHAQRSA